MSIGFILLILAGALVLFGAGQRVLDRLRLTDRQALLVIALILGGGFLPDIRITRSFSINLGGALIPLGLCVYLWIKADSFGEKVRSAVASLLTAIAIFLLGRFMPADPEALPMDPGWAYGIAAGVIAYVLGRSRRGAFIAGTLGVLLADLANWIYVRSYGVDQVLRLGGAGGFDVTVLAGLLAVLLSELIGETIERIKRGRRRPTREFSGGAFVGRERQP